MSLPFLAWPALLLLVGGVSGGDAPPAKPAVVDMGRFAKHLSGWAFIAGTEYPGATGTLTWNETAGHAEPGAASLQGDFSAGGRYVGMRIRKVDLQATEFACWVKPDGLAKSIMVRLTDANDQTFQYRLPLALGNDWQRLAVVPGTTVAESFYSGPKDGTWKGPLAAIVVGLSKEDLIQGTSASCLIDDATVTTPGR